MELCNFQSQDVQTRAQQILLEIQSQKQKLQSESQDWQEQQNKLLSDFLGDANLNLTPGSHAQHHAAGAAVPSASPLHGISLAGELGQPPPPAAASDALPGPSGDSTVLGSVSAPTPLQQPPCSTAQDTKSSTLNPVQLGHSTLIQTFANGNVITAEQIKARSQQILENVKKEAQQRNEDSQTQQSKLVEELLSNSRSSYEASTVDLISIPAPLPPPPPPVPNQEITMPLGLALSSDFTCEELANIQARGKEMLASMKADGTHKNSQEETSQLIDDFLNSSHPDITIAPSQNSMKADVKNVLALLSQLILPADNFSKDEMAQIKARSEQMKCEASACPLTDKDRAELKMIVKENIIKLPPIVPPTGDWQKLAAQLTGQEEDSEEQDESNPGNESPKQGTQSKAVSSTRKPGKTQKRKRKAADAPDLSAFSAQLALTENDEERKKRYKAIYSLLRPEKGIHTRDPDAPKRPLNSYNIFFKETRCKLKAQNRHNKFKKHELAHHVAQLWRNLPSDQKKTYEEQAEANRKRYDQEMKEYESNLQQNKPDILKPCLLEVWGRR